VRVSTDYAAFSGCTLVVEAVPEDAGLKATALAAVEEHLAEGAWLATNTSSLSVAGLAAASEAARPNSAASTSSTRCRPRR
jgi:3-hydroxybutyryl-CoA dehydrogenase